ncbi:MAG: aminopeptidase [Bacteroidota bacterium]|jgi:putative aminopeptidase FrvX|nr:aminopeptidase [Bacteroidota bacterium]
MKLLKEMCAIHAPSGNEAAMTAYLLDYIKKNKKSWKVKPKVYSGEGFQDCIVMVFGKPRTAIFAHIDSIGFTVRYGKQLVKIGGPRMVEGFELVGEDSQGKANVKLHLAEDKKTKEIKLEYAYKRDLETGTELTFKPDWREDKEYVQCCYMDNRLGVYNALKVAETLKDGVIVFSCYEEHNGGTVSFIQKFLQEKFKVKQALISDISWITEGVLPGKGPVISMRDSLIPRRSYVNKIIEIAKKQKLSYQLEVEGSGGSDAKELQMAEYAWDWCFVGAAEQHVHSPDEKVHKKDIQGMIDLYKALMEKL